MFNMFNETTSAATNNPVLVAATTTKETSTTRPGIAARLQALGGRAVSTTIKRMGDIKGLPERVFCVARKLPAGTSETARKAVQFVAAASQSSTARTAGAAGVKTVQVTGKVLKQVLPTAAAVTGAYLGGAAVGVAGAVAVYKTSGYIAGKFAGTEDSGNDGSGAVLPLAFLNNIGTELTPNEDAKDDESGETQPLNEKVTDDESGQTQPLNEKVTDDESGQTLPLGSATDDKSCQTLPLGNATDEKSCQTLPLGSTTDDNARTNPPANTVNNGEPMETGNTGEEQRAENFLRTLNTLAMEASLEQIRTKTENLKG
ncbi:MAG: hypothetical protein OXD32_06915, partial [Endozoicomonadaceae bacterium]|nr:hypothetical protein [Endozoicomonadaceae bacterium]